MSRLLTGLNPEQRAAVEHGAGPILVLAGAGSGKTRVITHRIAYLLERGVRPWQVLAVTFTNKAAGEMLERLRGLVGAPAEEVWVSTFHAAGVRILRRDGHKIGLPRSFTILDDSDQLSLMKRVLKELQVTDQQATPKDVLARIDHWKNQGLLPHEVRASSDEPAENVVLRAYHRYEDAKKGQGAVDFGDLLLRVVELLKASPDTREHYRRKFLYLLVDEFQDTNPVQYELLRLLGPDDPRQSNLCVVGDDDQSIYRWRGAEVRNILGFERDFPGARVVKLERNYRSTSRILDAAHSVISKNRARADKKLWTEGEQGEQLDVALVEGDRQEAAHVAERVAHAHRMGTHYGEIAVFYRTNAQSRLLEEALRQRHVPYAVVRGQSFYDRAEIRDVASYLRLLVNPKSDGDFLRAVGVPPRGIGDTTLDHLSAFAGARGISLWEAVGAVDFIPEIKKGAREKLAQFRALVSTLAARLPTLGAGAMVEAVAHESGLLDRLALDTKGEAIDRQENVREFIHAAKEFDTAWSQVLGTTNPAGPARGAAGDADIGTAQLAALRALRGDADTEAPSALEAFLAQVAVLGDSDVEGSPERVSLMTLHSAKGLEFDVVFLTGLEEGVFPTGRALDDDEQIAEERRLCYVGLTRARKKVWISLARSRALFGELKFNAPSRFLLELPKEHVRGLDAVARAGPPAWAQRGDSQYGGAGPVAPRPGAPRPSGTWLDRDDPAGSDWEDVPARPPPRLVPPSRTPPSRAPEVPRQLEVKTHAPKKAAGRVRHAKFGEGKVIARQGEGPDAKLTILFPGVGPKTVVARFLELLD
jgi:DNA helicase-2/ATP-dependent DNA helicase PcrA